MKENLKEFGNAFKQGFNDTLLTGENFFEVDGDTIKTVSLDYVMDKLGMSSTEELDKWLRENADKSSHSTEFEIADFATGEINE